MFERKQSPPPLLLLLQLSLPAGGPACRKAPTPPTALMTQTTHHCAYVSIKMPPLPKKNHIRQETLLCNADEQNPPGNCSDS